MSGISGSVWIGGLIKVRRHVVQKFRGRLRMAVVRRVGLENWHTEGLANENQASEQIIQFDCSRRAFEARLRELDDEAAQRFEPVVAWMRQVVAIKAPELLTT